MAQSAKQPQGREALLKSYNKRLKDDVKSILDNFMGKSTEFSANIRPYLAILFFLWHNIPEINLKHLPCVLVSKCSILHCTNTGRI